MGLVPTKMNIDPQAAPADQQRDPARYTDETDSGVTPEEQAQYSKFEQNYMRLIYTDDGQVNPDLLKSLAAGTEGQPIDTQGEASSPQIMALASTAVTIVQRLDDSAREAGKPLSDDVLFQGGAAVVEELAEVAEAAGIYDYSEDEMSGALTVAVDMYRSKAVQDGRTNEETLAGQFDQILSGQDQQLEAAAQQGVPENGGR